MSQDGADKSRSPWEGESHIGHVPQMPLSQSHPGTPVKNSPTTSLDTHGMPPEVSPQTGAVTSPGGLRPQGSQSNTQNSGSFTRPQPPPPRSTDPFSQSPGSQADDGFPCPQMPRPTQAEHFQQQSSQGATSGPQNRPSGAGMFSRSQSMPSPIKSEEAYAQQAGASKSQSEHFPRPFPMASESQGSDNFMRGPPGPVQGDPYSMQPGTPRPPPAADPYARQPSTPRPMTDPYAQPPLTPHPATSQQELKLQHMIADQHPGQSQMMVRNFSYQRINKLKM